MCQFLTNLRLRNKVLILVVVVLLVIGGLLVWKYKSSFGFKADTYADCVRRAPTVVIMPTNGLAGYTTGVYPVVKIPAGQSANFDVRVTNNDVSCPVDNYVFSSSVPSGWQAEYNYAFLQIGAGATWSAILTLTPPLGTLEDRYSFTATATAQTGGTSTSVTSDLIQVAETGVTVSLTLNQSIIQPSNWKKPTHGVATTTVEKNGKPLSNIEATFFLAYPDGYEMQRYVYHFTNSKGTVSWKFPIYRFDPKGTYVMTVTALDTGVPIGGDRATFLVK